MDKKEEIQKLVASQISGLMLKIEHHLKSIPSKQFKELRRDNLYINYNMNGEVTSVAKEPLNFISIDTEDIIKKSDISDVVEDKLEGLYNAIINRLNESAIALPDAWLRKDENNIDNNLDK